MPTRRPLPRRRSNAVSSLKTASATVGLRERKKAKTLAAIQREAMRLFKRQGYAATTVEQIAAAADVSPSTFFRYFPAKEDVALYDALDPAMFAAFQAQPAHLSSIAALRVALRRVLSESSAEVALQTERAALVLAVPELRMRMLDEFVRSIDAFSAVLAARAGRPADDVGVRGLAGAVIGVGIAAWLASDGVVAQDFLDRMDSGLEQLEAGFAF